MSEDLKHTIYNQTDCLSEKTLFDYIDNKLTQKERHIVEKHLLDCEMCSDALEGLELVSDRNRIALIKEAINKRVGDATKKEAVVVSFNYKMAFSIAAAIALLVVGVFFFKNIGLKEATMGDMAELKETESPAPPPPPPSIVEESAASDSAGETRLTMGGTKSEVDKLSPSKVIDEEIAFVEEQKPGFYKGKEGAGEAANQEAPVEVSGNATVVFDATITTTKDNRNELESITIPKTSAPEREKKAKLDDAKKAEEKSVSGAAGGTYAWSTPDQKQKNTADNATSGENSDLAKKSDKDSGGKYRSEGKLFEQKNKAKKAQVVTKESSKTEDQNFGLISTAPQSVSQDADELKSEVVTNTATTVSISDSIGPVYTIVEEMPEYPGGNVAFVNAAMKEINLLGTTPRDDDGQISTTILIEFIVNASGKAVQPKLVKPKNSELQKQVVQFVNKMPLWKPGKKDNKNVAVKMILPIKVDPK